MIIFHHMNGYFKQNIIFVKITLFFTQDVNFFQLPPKNFLVVVGELLGSKCSTNKTDKVLISHSCFSDLEQEQVTIDKLLEHKYFL